MIFTVLFLTVFVDLITAVAIGMIMASMVFMQRMVNLQLDSITAITEPHPEAQLAEEEEEIMQEAGGRLLLFHLSGPMSFGAAKGTARRLAGFDQYDILLIDLTDVPQVDFTSSRAIDDMVHDAVDKGGHAFLVGARPAVCSMLIRQGALWMVPEDHRFQHRLPALRHALKLIQDKAASQEES